MHEDNDKLDAGTLTHSGSPPSGGIVQLRSAYVVVLFSSGKEMLPVGKTEEVKN